MSKDGDIVIGVPAGKLSFTNYSPEVFVSKINEAIEISDNIPADAKIAVKDFIKENIQEIINKIEHLLEIDVPEEIAEIWPLVAEIIKSLFGA